MDSVILVQILNKVNPSGKAWIISEDQNWLFSFVTVTSLWDAKIEKEYCSKNRRHIGVPLVCYQVLEEAWIALQKLSQQ